MTWAPGQLVMHHAMPGMGKSMMMHQLLAQQAMNGNIIVIDTEGSHAILLHDRKTPAPHDPIHTPLQKMGEGIRRAMHLLDETSDRMLEHLYYELREMRAACQLVRVQFARNQPLPGKGRGAGGTHPHKIKWIPKDFLETRHGAIDCAGNTWATVDEAVAKLSAGRAGIFSKTAVCEKNIMASHQYAVDEMAWRIFRRTHLADEVRDELTVAWLEAGSPQVERNTSGRRL